MLSGAQLSGFDANWSSNAFYAGFFCLRILQWRPLRLHQRWSTALRGYRRGGSLLATGALAKVTPEAAIRASKLARIFLIADQLPAAP